MTRSLCATIFMVAATKAVTRNDDDDRGNQRVYRGKTGQESKRGEYLICKNTRNER